MRQGETPATGSDSDQRETIVKVGILGSGVVAQAFAQAFVKKGHQVLLGTRDVTKLKEFVEQHPGVATGSFADAAKFGDLVVLAVKGTVVLDVVKAAAGTDNLAGKPVIDATNPIADAPPVNGVLKFFTSLDDSLMERLQRAVPAAHFVKAFNSVGSAFMVDPHFPGGKPTMFICGNDEGAKRIVRGIIDQFGWETADMGKIEAARAIEPLCMLWCIPGLARNEWSHAFKVLRA
jgi:8-hydroxy-5-deazaflavin:NADPH oxidoreductase